MFVLFVITFALSFLISLIATYFVKGLAIKFNLIDNAKLRKHPAQIHQGSIPRAGGLAIYLGIIIPTLILLPLNKALIGILLGATLTIIMGLLDDKYDLNPYVRFLGNIASALFVVSAGVGIPYINNPFGGVIELNTIQLTINFLGSHKIFLFADLVALLFIIWTMNVVGWSSGVDGQLPGFVSIASLVLAILSLKFTAHDISQYVITALAIINMGAYLGFLPWNFYPQKIMPGYGGKSLAGFMLATLSILSGAKVGTMILVLGLPMTDAIYTILRRILAGKSPVWADRGHFHHKLLDRGWGIRRISIMYWIVSAILGIISLTVSSDKKLFVFLTLVVIVGGILFWVNFITKEFTPRNFEKK